MFLALHGDAVGWSVVCNCGNLDHTFQVDIDVYEDKLSQSRDRIPSSDMYFLLITLLQNITLNYLRKQLLTL